MSSSQEKAMSSISSSIIAVVLAGGYGTRIKHLLNGVPKPMALVAGKPFIEWVVRYLQVQGITKAFLSTGYLGEVIKQYFEAQPVNGIEIICCQEESPLGTAGGFLNTVYQSGESPDAWLVMNGDSLIFSDLTLLTNHLLDNTVSGVIVGLSTNDASRYGSLICNQRSDLIKFAEKSSGAGLISAGVYLLRHSLLDEFPQDFPLSFEEDVFPSLLAKNIRLKVPIINAPFLDIGTPDSLPLSEAFISQNYSKLC
ncbi:MAG: sugar phosphate nucleotidyltransferase [Pseudanabaena sp.]|jgi:D-glycero-alpha-D-manno-heptose 1-phosphate guanylyltransferase